MTATPQRVLNRLRNEFTNRRELGRRGENDKGVVERHGRQCMKTSSRRIKLVQSAQQSRNDVASRPREKGLGAQQLEEESWIRMSDV